MSHQHGAYLGGIRSVADVRLRCVIDAECGCWHLRTPHGRLQPRHRVHRLWLHGRGSVSATRAVWELQHGKPMPRGRRAVRMCDSYDCANPEHIRALLHREAQRHIVGHWHQMTLARQQALTALQRSSRRFTAEQLAEIRLGNQSAAALARKWGCSATAVCDVRNGKTYRNGPPRSIWELAA